MEDDWRILEALKLLRQFVVCPTCGSLVGTQAGIDTHVNWHKGVDEYVANLENRLDIITNYIVAPETGLEPRVIAEFNRLRQDATNAIFELTDRVAALEAAS